MAKTWGGTRQGAGRKPKREKHAAVIERSTARLAKSLQATAEALIEAATQGGKTVKTVYEAVGVVQIEAYEDILDAEGKPTGRTRRFKRLAFPDLAVEDATQLVEIRREETQYPPDVRAMAELLSRVMGKPAAENEAEAYEAQVEAFIERVLTAMQGLDEEIREQVVTQLRAGSL